MPEANFQKKAEKVLLKAEIKYINNNKNLWKTMAVPLSDNSSKSSRISLVDKDKIVSDDFQLA